MRASALRDENARLERALTKRAGELVDLSVTLADARALIAELRGEVAMLKMDVIKAKERRHEEG